MSQATPLQSIRIARCEVAGRTFGLNLATIVGIQPREVVQFHTNDSDVAVGTIASLGRKLPVYSLAQLLGLPRPNTRTGHCIVATDGVDVWGLLVDRVSQSESRTGSEVVSLPALITGSAESMILGVVCHAGDQELPLIVLDLKRLRPRDPDASNNAVETPNPNSGDPEIPPSRLDATQRRFVTFAPAAAADTTHVRYAFSVRQVSEITRIPKSVQLPGSPDFVVGLAVWRKRPLPIVRLASKNIEGETLTEASARMAIVKVPECELPLGVLVDAECEMLSCPISGSPVPAASVDHPEHRIRAAFQVGNQTLLFPRFAERGMPQTQSQFVASPSAV